MIWLARFLAVMTVASIGALVARRCRRQGDDPARLTMSILGVAVVAFVVGVGLQIWRQRRIEAEFLQGRFSQAVAETAFQGELYSWGCVSALALATLGAAFGAWRGVGWARLVLVLFALVWAGVVLLSLAGRLASLGVA